MTGTSSHDSRPPDQRTGKEETRPLDRVPWRRFIVLGDIGAGGLGRVRGRGADKPWADRVAETLRSTRPDLAYLNLGRHGHSAAQVRARQLAQALAFRSDLAAVVAGGHEAVADSFDVDAVEAELHRIVGPLRDTGADVITVGLYGPRLLGAAADRAGGLQQRLRLLAERTGELALRHGAFHVDVLSDGGGRRTDADDHEVAAAVIRRLVTHLASGRVAA
ncbi:GDSL-type esterase/lipase family protein [Streptomyces sp. NRRL B-1347]|uniref:GDSL-type esterase/lipase family protein n=1 Tax=Streptomyces sp. NRRL B-1347 TaxID=1476877 RepID=UPI0007C4F908|nr:GDSL-type esterase/lipase family protein [Streptomyces sp. NRRL B-1347]